jgi:hypothetical protein
MWMAVEPRRAPFNKALETGPRACGATQWRVFWSRQSRKAWGGSAWSVRTVNRHRWARRVASGERVKRGQGTRHTDPVTSEEGMPGSVRELRKGPLKAESGRSESAQATV